ncbi:chitin deacetylase [Irineochytrium annulatum]|nr:chitin deacetylase [Irineochytrium annulatum]
MSPVKADPSNGAGAYWGASNYQTAAPLTASTSPLHANEWDISNPYVELCGCPAGKWSVSYDDGPLQYEPEFLDTLAAANVKATFFVIGGNVIKYADNLKAAYQAGHQIGIHTWTHPYTSTKTTDSIVSETLYAAMAIYGVIGQVPRYWRPPHGDIDNRVRAIMGALGLRVAMWNVDAIDWSIGEGPIAANRRNWTADNATAVLDGVFKNGFYANFWAQGGDVSQPASWVNLTWLPGPPAPYTGFMSLEHELTEGDHALATSYLNTIFNTTYPFLPGGPGKFTPALVHECDTATANGAKVGPYMDETDPFYNMVTYWYTKLPITPDVMKATGGYPTDFSRPLVNATVSALPVTASGSATGLPGTAAVVATSTGAGVLVRNGERRGRGMGEWVVVGAMVLVGLTVLGL